MYPSTFSPDIWEPLMSACITLDIATLLTQYLNQNCPSRQKEIAGFPRQLRNATFFFFHIWQLLLDGISKLKQDLCIFFNKMMEYQSGKKN